MPGMIERTKAQRPGRSSIPFPITPHSRRQENLRKQDDKSSPADMAGDKASPHFMAGTTSSSIRSITPTTKTHKRAPTPHSLLALSFGPKRGDRRRLNEEDDHSTDVETEHTREDTPSTTRSRDTTPVSPPDKPLPGLPAAQVITMSPPKQSRTLIDAMERPLRVSIGTPDEMEWPVLYPSQPSTPQALETFAQLHSIDNKETSCEMGADRDQDRMTIKLLTPGGRSDPPSTECTNNHTDESEDGKDRVDLATDHTDTDEQRPKAKLVDIPPRQTSSEQSQKAKSTAKSPNGSIPRYVGAHRENRRPRMRPAPAALNLTDLTHKKSAIPVAAKSPSLSSPVVHEDVPAKVFNTPTATHSLSTVKDEMVCMDDEPGANTLMRCGPQRRPTYRESARHQAYSAEPVDETEEAVAAMLASHQGSTPPIPSRAPSRKGSVPHRGIRLRESSIFTEHLTVTVAARPNDDDDKPKDAVSKLKDHDLALAQLEGSTGLVKRFSGKKRASVHSARASITKTPQVAAVENGEKNARRSSLSSRPSVHTRTPRVSTIQNSETAAHRRSVPSTASFRPPVPAKDSIRHQSNKKPPQGLTYGVSATPSTVPLLKTVDNDSFGPETLTPSATKNKPTARNKLAFGLRGLFHKKSTDLKRASTTLASSPAPELPDIVTTHSKKRMSNFRHKRTPSHLPEKALPENPPAAAKDPERARMKATDIAQEFVRCADVETDDTRRAQLLSVASALVTAVECMKKASIAREKAEQAAREAAMHQEIVHESLRAINRLFGGDGGATTTAASAATLSRSGRRTPKTPIT